MVFAHRVARPFGQRLGFPAQPATAARLGLLLELSRLALVSAMAELWTPIQRLHSQTHVIDIPATMIFAHRVATGIRFPGSADVYPRHGHTRVASFPGSLEKLGPKFSRDPGLPDLWCTRVPGPSGLKPTRLLHNVSGPRAGLSDTVPFPPPPPLPGGPWKAPKIIPLRP